MKILQHILSKSTLLLLGYFVVFINGSSLGAVTQTDAPVKTVVPVIIRKIPHDTAAFTQGLLWYRGYLYESTGIEGRSSLRKIDPATGRILLKKDIPMVFGEGLARAGSTLTMLTWKNGIAMRFTLEGFSSLDYARYSGEGWGLTHDGKNFVMSNGSDSLYWRNSKFETVRAVKVSIDGNVCTNLNELEAANGFVYANIWYQPVIVEIVPSSGKVRRIIDCRNLVALGAPQPTQDVLNGIAWCESSKTFYLTGKNWRYVFEVRIPK